MPDAMLSDSGALLHAVFGASPRESAILISLYIVVSESLKNGLFVTLASFRARTWATVHLTPNAMIFHTRL